MESERRLLAQLAPDMDEDLIRRLVAAFQDLRRGYEEGKLSYPYSLRGDAFALLVLQSWHVVLTLSPFRVDQSCSAYACLRGFSGD